MTNESSRYRGYRFPAEIVSHAVGLYHRFALSLRDTEYLLAQRGVTVTHETIRRWCRAEISIHGAGASADSSVQSGTRPST
jgi:putative transposase